MIPADTFNFDDDGSTTEETPDLDLNDLRVVCSVEMGCYEYQPTCEGDVNGDGVVGQDDEDAVTNNWGHSGGYGDCYPWPCGDGIVNVNDLLLVIGHWDNSCGLMEDGFTEGESESVQECLEAALGSDLTGTEFIDFLLNCLCSHGIGCP